MREVVVNGLIAGPLGVVMGFLLSFWQQRWAAKQAERERQLAAMQQFVVEVLDLERARKVYREAHLSPTTRLYEAGMAVLEFWSTWSARGRSWDAAAVALAPSARVVTAWNRRVLDEGVALTTHFVRVAAVGLPLGMVKNRAIAAAAQGLLDAALEDQGEAAVIAAIKALRGAFGLNPADPARVGS